MIQLPVYLVLNKLCENKLIEADWKTVGGRKRKYYKITNEIPILEYDDNEISVIMPNHKKSEL